MKVLNVMFWPCPGSKLFIRHYEWNSWSICSSSNFIWCILRALSKRHRSNHFPGHHLGLVLLWGTFYHYKCCPCCKSSVEVNPSWFTGILILQEYWKELPQKFASCRWLKVESTFIIEFSVIHLGLCWDTRFYWRQSECSTESTPYKVTWYSV